MTSKLFSEVLYDWVDVFMHRSFRDFKRFMEENDLSPTQVHALMRLHHGKECGVSEIATHLGITNAAASQMVDRLVKAGLMYRMEEPLDRRVKTLSLTPAGRDLVERSVDARKCWMESLTEELSSDQQENIAQALIMLTEAARRLEDVRS